MRAMTAAVVAGLTATAFCAAVAARAGDGWAVGLAMLTALVGGWWLAVWSRA